MSRSTAQAYRPSTIVVALLRVVARSGRRLARRLLPVEPPQIGLVSYDEFVGDWEAAEAASTGWSTDVILERVLASSLRVRDGAAVHERDGVNFDRIHYAWPILSALLWVAAQRSAAISVVDMGGSLGTSYRQNRKFLASLSSVRWAIVEQDNFVRAGREHFTDDVVTFHSTMVEADRAVRPDVILCSGVMGYLPDWQDLLDQFSASTADFLLLDRVPNHDGDEPVLAIQSVSSDIYPASFPLYILPLRGLMDHLSSTWESIEVFPSVDGKRTTAAGLRFRYSGMILRRRAR